MWAHIWEHTHIRAHRWEHTNESTERIWKHTNESTNAGFDSTPYIYIYIYIYIYSILGIRLVFKPEQYIVSLDATHFEGYLIEYDACLPAWCLPYLDGQQGACSSLCALSLDLLFGTVSDSVQRGKILKMFQDYKFSVIMFQHVATISCQLRIQEPFPTARLRRIDVATVWRLKAGPGKDQVIQIELINKWDKVIN